MLPAKILSTSYKKNRAGKEVLTCVAEIRKGQNVTAEVIQSRGEASRPVNGEWVVIVPREQTIGGHFALGFVDIINAIQSERGVKIIYGRDESGNAKTKITLTDVDIVIENPDQAAIKLSGDEIILNAGDGDALEAERTQTALEQFSDLILAELNKISTLLEPKNPAVPYQPPVSLPVDLDSAKSKTIKLP